MPQREAKPNILRREAAVPCEGTAAFFISTYFENNAQIIPYYTVLSDFLRKIVAVCNLLSQRHYFRRELAKSPPAVAVIAEGRKTVSSREVRP
ncbi:MAG: hypothetical protein AAGU27_28495 [Dehalobacterium sp.]